MVSLCQIGPIALWSSAKGGMMRRRLAAILAADMVGYSRLMSADEEGTIMRQNHVRSTIIDPAIAGNDGRIVKTTGDGLLVEFGSAVDAVRCAVSVQHAIAAAEAETDEESRIRYRIGINVGDIVADGDDVLGDGVNIAARLESLSEPGGISVSDIAFQSVRGKLDSAFTDLGPQPLKNIADPVRVWKWIDPRNQQTDGAMRDAKSIAGSKPSIAVLPFNNMSGDQEQEYFADGMAEDLITELSRMPWFYVVARNTSFTYKGAAVDIKAAGRELGVAYILEGSVRKSGNRVRITAQLIDTDTGNHVWADRYDREFVDVFDIQDEITRAIIGAISPEFISAEVKKSRHKEASQLDAWECVMRGRAHIWKFGRKDAEIARGLFEQAIEASPGGVMGLADLALVHYLDTFYRWSGSPQDSMKKMVETAKKAVAADENDPLALTILAWAHLFSYQWDEAIETIDLAVSISPNFAPAIGVRGAIYACTDEPEIAIAAFKDAITRSPRDAFLPFWLMGVFWAFHTIEDYETAAHYARQSVRIAPDNPTFNRQLAVAYGMLGQDDRCREAVATYLRVEPGATAQDALNIPATNKEALHRFVDTLKTIGVPEAASQK